MSFVISAEMALGFPGGCSYLQKPWRQRMAPLPHEFISEPCRNILGEFVFWDVGDNSLWNCSWWHPEPFMSGAMHILAIVVGPESARLRTSGGYSTSCSPFVQRRLHFSLTVSSKDVSVLQSPVPLWYTIWSRYLCSSLEDKFHAWLDSYPQLQTACISLQRMRPPIDSTNTKY